VAEDSFFEFSPGFGHELFEKEIASLEVHDWSDGNSP
jgi:hypothetical protein